MVRKTYTSKGQRRNVVNGKGKKNDWTPLQELNHKVDAWMKGKKVFLTITNPNKNEKGKPFIKKEAKEVWGKYTPYLMKTSN